MFLRNVISLVTDVTHGDNAAQVLTAIYARSGTLINSAKN
jgi:hypothetical protein